MTTKQFVSLEKSLLPQLPPFVIKDKIMIMLPMKHFLRGINFDPSAFSKTSFSVTTFIMPLFVPHTHLALNFANRIRKQEGGDRWDFNAPRLVDELGAAIKEHAIPNLSSIQSLADFVKMARQVPSRNPHTLRAIAFALILNGKSQEAVEVIDELIPGLDLKSAWQIKLGETVECLKNKLIKNPIEARQQLLDWEEESLRNLGLSELHKPTIAPELPEKDKR